MRKSTSGFTIVELLIVIVVIAILAAISVVAYNGIQERSRTASRISAIRSIQKGLESYKAIHGNYPNYYSIGTNQPPGFTPVYGAAYEYSVATNDSWMKTLRTSDTVSKPVFDPINDNNHYFVYIAYNGGTGSCRESFYMLASEGWEGGASTMPDDSRTLTCSISGSYTAAWTKTSTRAVFSNLNHPVGE